MTYLESFLSFEGLIAFLTLFALELVLGIDNIIFISIISDKLPKNQQSKARMIGLSLAVLTRLLLLFSISWIMSLTEPFFSVFGKPISGRDIILFLGGLFLIAKSTHEIHLRLEEPEEVNKIKVQTTFFKVIVQILILDMVFSLDSVITAVGMVNDLPIMVAAILASTAIMIVSSHSISYFIDKHPTLKMLALSFLVLIGVTLIVESFGQHISKAYIYFALSFSIGVEILNILTSKKRKKSKQKG